jgi:hypothetical protein
LVTNWEFQGISQLILEAQVSANQVLRRKKLRVLIGDRNLPYRASSNLLVKEAKEETLSLFRLKHLLNWVMKWFLWGKIQKEFLKTLFSSFLDLPG